MTNLFLIVGNSGSGKDSLIFEVKKNFPEDLKEVRIPKRVITRPPSPETEDFESISVQGFLELKEKGEFMLHWHIYDLYYGVRNEVENWMEEGYPILINVSRNVIPEAREKYPGLKVIFIRVPFEITAKRIKDRGREDEEKMKARLERARSKQDMPEADFVVDNSGNLEEAAKTLLDYIIAQYKESK